MILDKLRLDDVHEIFERGCKHQPQTVEEVIRVGDTIGVKFDSLPNVHMETTTELENIGLKISGFTPNDDADSEMLYLRPIHDA